MFPAGLSLTRPLSSHERARDHVPTKRKYSSALCVDPTILYDPARPTERMLRVSCDGERNRGSVPIRLKRVYSSKSIETMTDGFQLAYRDS